MQEKEEQEIFEKRNKTVRTSIVEKNKSLVKPVEIDYFKYMITKMWQK